MTSYQQQLLAGVLGVFLVGGITGYAIAKWGTAPPCQQVTDVGTLPGAASKNPAEQPSTNQAAGSGVVKNVIDGATIEVEGIGLVKLAGVEVSPKLVSEDSDPTHKDAVTYLRTELLDKTAKLEKAGEPSSGLYFVYTPGGMLVNVDLVRRGLVFKSDNAGNSHSDDLREAMGEAIRTSHGIWKSNTATAVNTTDNTDKNKIDAKKTPDPIAGHPDRPLPPSNSSGVKKNELEVSVLPGSSVYHRPDCPEVKGKTGQVKMYISDARSAGLKPDSKCFTSVTMRAP